MNKMEYRCKLCGEAKPQEQMRKNKPGSYTKCKACFAATRKPQSVHKVRNRSNDIVRHRWLQLWWLPEAVEAYQKGIDQPDID